MIKIKKLKECKIKTSDLCSESVKNFIKKIEVFNFL